MNFSINDTLFDVINMSLVIFNFNRNTVKKMEKKIFCDTKLKFGKNKKYRIDESLFKNIVVRLYLSIFLLFIYSYL